MEDNLSVSSLFIGPERTGTTWIYEYLLSRKDINLPIGTKETFFFDNYYHKGIQWYLRHFNHRYTITVEVAPTYFKSKKAPNRIKKNIPHVNIVCSIRNPLERSISHFNHLVRYGCCKPTFSEAVRTNPEIINASLYYKNIVHWINVFGKKNVSILWYDELKFNQDIFISHLCQFLNIKFVPAPEELRRKKVNPLTSPHSYFLASVGNTTKNFFRSRQLYSIVEIAKRIGMKKIFYGNECKEMKLPEKKDIFNLIQLFSKDLYDLSKLLGIDIDQLVKEMKSRFK